MSKTLACVGELRATQLLHLHDQRNEIEILTATPGFTEIPDAARELYGNPTKQLSSRLSSLLQATLLETFSSEIDKLPKGVDWGRRLAEWLEPLNSGACSVRFFDSMPLFSRVISTSTRSLVFSHPLAIEETPGHELHLSVEGAEHERIVSWFNAHFASSNDITKDVARCIRESWAGELISPLDAYRKVLVSYFDEVLLSLDRDYDLNPLLEHLTEFQIEAYHYAKFILRRYGGVFLADVVGLGKTYIAMALLKHLQDAYGQHPVVIAPPKVIPAWEALAEEHRVELKLVSIGKLHDLERYRDREVLVVDESHNFRNSGTRRFDELSTWVRPTGEAATRKVLLLSATPQNNSVTDIRHQLSLFPDNYSALPLKTESLDEWCREVRAGTRSATELLQHVVVRRTRRYIKEAFPNATIARRSSTGELTAVPLRFPERVSGPEQCLRYSLTETYHGQLYQRILTVLAELEYPLHALGSYLTEAGKEHPHAQGIRRSGSTVRGLFKVLLLKRLESSFYAFRISIQRLEGRLAQMLEALDRGNVPAVRDLGDQLEDDDDLQQSPSPHLSLDLFDGTLLKKTVRQDLLEVRSLVTLITDLNDQTDAKFQRLLDFLARRPPSEHKTIIFTQFGDTAQYIADGLRNQQFELEVARGGDARALTHARRFSPRSNYYDLQECQPELQLLVSTDVLSEGVNLQDADTLINYDLHWNPVRLIQRAGRIGTCQRFRDSGWLISMTEELRPEAV